MRYDVKKMLLASILIIGIGAVLVVISLILQLLSVMIGGDTGQTIDLISTVYAFLLYPVMLALYIWAGVRATRSYGFDAIGAGIVTAFSHLVIGVIQLVIGLLLSLVVMSKGPVGAGFATPESVVAAAVFEDVMGMKGVGLSAICGIGILVFGAVVNFVVGGVGSIIAQSRNKNTD
jgi:hypothetical protein